jgi:putative ABC transport system permease protein
MVRSYIITALRALIRNLITSVINIAGLAAGIAASILIMLYVFSELSTDRFNENYDRIYRLEVGDFVVTGTAQALILKEAFPEVKQTVRMDFRHRPVARHSDEYFRMEELVYADSTLFDIFSFEFLRGNPSDALYLPFSLVLTRSESKRLFGNEDPMGRVLTFNNAHDFTVTAIIEDITNFHLPVLAIASFSSLPYIENDENHDRHLFSYMNFFTYVLFHENIDPLIVSGKLDRLIDERYPETRRFSLLFRPLEDIYFNRDLDDSPPVRHGNLPLVYTLIAVAGFILLIAIVNFINLATANASVRYGEIGVRKVMGAGRENLIFQFLTESVIMSSLAFLLGIFLVEMLLPVFNNLLSVNLSFNPFYSHRFFFSLILLVFLTGILAGLYPAFYLSSLKAGSILKGEVTKGSGTLIFRRALIVFQFTISITLIISTIVVHRQVEYMRNKHLGFNKENILTVRLNRDIITAGDVFRDKLVKHDAIESVSMSNNIPGYITWFNTWVIEGEHKPHKFLPVDPEYIDLMEIELETGRNFDRSRIADQEYTYVLNEEAVKYFGFEDPAGKEFMVGGPVPVRIIGVARNFHFRSLHEPIGPLVMGWQPGNLGLANIRIKPGQAEEALVHVRQQWETLSPGSFLEFRFLDDEIDKLYRSEIRIGRLFRYFALIAVIIACMGLYGLSTFIAYQRKKEIGIRKVLGSSVSQIVFFLVSEYAKWVIVSNLIAWPLAYFAMDRWLDNFPYRTETGLLIFISSGLIALLIAVITVSVQAWRTANMNPADSLRCE